MPYKTTIPVPVLPYVPAVTDTVSIASPKFNTGIKKIFEDYSTSRDLLDQVTLNTLALTSQDTSGVSGNFDFLKSVTLYIKAAGLPEKQLATKDSIPAGTSKIDFSTSKVNMTEYIAKDTISIRMFAKQRGPNTKALKLVCDMKFHVNAKILGK